MRKVISVLVVALMIAVLCTAGALAKGFEFGGDVSYGTLNISDHNNYDRYGTKILLFNAFGAYEMKPGMSIGASYTYGRGPGEQVSVDNGSYDPHSFNYTNLKVEGTFPVLENVSLLAGWTAFTSGYTEYYGYASVNKGNGFKVGFSANASMGSAVAATVKYAFLPYVYSEGWQEGYLDETYVGVGHELDARLNMTFKSGLGAFLGLKSEVYNGTSDCCLDYLHDLAGFKGVVLGLSYRF